MYNENNDIYMRQRMVRRREFIKKGGILSAGLISLQHISASYTEREKKDPAGNQIKERIRFSVIGLNHPHIYSLVETVINGGGKLVSFFSGEADLMKAFGDKYTAARSARSKEEILEDKTIQLIVSAAIPNERAIIGMEAMRHGKDFLSDKPGITSLELLQQVKSVQQNSGRIYSILYGDRLENKATIRAEALVKDGAIGKVIQTIGLGPHKMNIETRPEWFFNRKYFGGILTDLGSHQFDQFLFFTGSSSAEVVASQVGNLNNRKYPEIEDFGDATLRGNGGTGYLRVDWFTPQSLGTWGDGRLTILGTEGYIEIRKNIDISGKSGGNHLFMANRNGVQYFNCDQVKQPFGAKLVDDVLNRTETAMAQAHCFLATELSLIAQKNATSLSETIQ